MPSSPKGRQAGPASPVPEPKERRRARRPRWLQQSKGPSRWSAAAPPRIRDAAPILETYVSRALRAQHDLDVHAVGDLDAHELSQRTFVRVEVDEPLVFFFKQKTAYEITV